jgi:hypothetical protein
MEAIMATSNVTDLKARCKALGYELIIGDDGTQFVIEHRTQPHDLIEVLFIHRSDVDDDLEGWIADREQVSERVRKGNGADEQDDYLFHGDYPLPPELQPALDLYKRLFYEAEALTDDVIMRRLGGCEILVGRYGHEYAIMRPNLTRRGVSFFYADWKFHEILSGVEPADNLREQTVAEIREEHPDADEQEIKLRVALRESIGMTREEEDLAYARIAKALS